MSRPEPRFDIDKEIGYQSELWVTDLRKALQSGSVEVKRDCQFIETGNIYVEYECLRRGKYKPSGIKTTTAGLWVFVLIEGTLGLVITTDELKVLARTAFRNPRNHREIKRGSHPTKGIVLSVAEIIRHYVKKAER